MTINKLVVFLLPLYRAELRDLSKTLKSIETQSYEFIKCVIVDDLPNKYTESYIKKFDNKRNKYTYHANTKRTGLPGSLNIAINSFLPIADYFARIDCGDVCNEDRILQQVSFLENNPHVSILGSAIYTTIDGLSIDNIIYFPENDKDIKKAFIYMNPIAHPTVMIRPDVFSRLGVYDETFAYSEDLELWLRFSNRGVVFHNSQNPLLTYRVNHAKRSWKNYLYNYRARIKNAEGSLLNYISACIPLLSIFIPKKIFAQFYKYVKGICNISLLDKVK